VLRAALGRKTEEPGAGEEGAEGVWAWSILPFLKGDQPDLEERVHRIGLLERHLPAIIAPALAHHRYILFEPAETAGPDRAFAPTHTS